MTVCEETIRLAGEIARSEDAFLRALHEWHDLKGQIKTEFRQKNFDDWLYAMLCESSTHIDGIYHGEQTAEQIAAALRVDAMGDPLANKVSEEARTDGFKTDINCYVEDGCVEDSIWMSGDDPDRVKTRADEICERFTGEGYSAEVWIDEEDDHDVTVNAVIDFNVYLTPLKSDVQ